MSDPIGQQLATGIDAGTRTRAETSALPEPAAIHTWFASESIALGAIALPPSPTGTGVQDLDALIDGILAPIGH